MYRKLIKYLTKAFFAVIFIVILLHIISIPVKKELSAKEIRMDDPTYIEDAKIYISGFYHFNIFTEDTFEGQIAVSDFRLTTEKKMRRVRIGKDGDELDYSYKENDGSSSINMYYCLGLIFSDSLFRNMCVLVYSYDDNPKDNEAKLDGNLGSWGTQDGYCIVPSVNNREEAISILNKHRVLEFTQ